MIDEKKFTYEIALSIRVGQFLRSKGYTPADLAGNALCELVDDSGLGILKTDSRIPDKRKVCGSRILKKRKKAFIGFIRFGTQGNIANEADWSIEAYGTENVSELMRLSHELLATFDVNINLRLVQEQQRLETWSDDSEE